MILRSSQPSIARRWDSFMAAWDAVVWCDPRTFECTAAGPDGKVLRRWDDPLAALDWMSGSPLSDGARWVGYLGYDLGRAVERLPAMATDDLGLPVFAFARVTPGPMGDRWAARPVAARAEGHRPVTSTFSRAGYESAVGRALEYIAAGDIFQVNLSQRFAVQSPLPADEVFDRLQQSGGAHYGAVLEFEDFAIVSHSPELFLRVVRNSDGSRTVVTRPMKGTRPIAAGMDDQLRDSVKDQAELNMIIDLERNDLGRVCRIGSVRVAEPRTIETHPTVYQGVAAVEGTLRPGVSFVDLLRATFPGGSITGAPKIRAMEIIEELEPVRRGPYCGAIGYLAADGAMDFSVAIRTMTMKDGRVYVPVGGGIVADSEPGAEYEETLVKARAMLAALGVSDAAIR
jgi:para-aminobenzoate synthetase component 1